MGGTDSPEGGDVVIGAAVEAPVVRERRDPVTRPVWVSEESNGDARAWQESPRLARSPDAGVDDWTVLSGQTIPPYVDPEYESYLPAGLR